MLLSSAKFKDKAQEVVKEGLEKKPVLDMVEKRQGDEGGSSQHVQLEGIQDNQAGLMLYTSGTTSRPVGETSCIPWTPLTEKLRKAYSSPNPS